MKLNIKIPGIPARISELTIGRGLIQGLPKLLAARLGSRSAYWIWDERVWGLWGKRTAELGWPIGDPSRLVLFPASETNKRLSALEQLARQLVQSGADRNSVLIAVGGGVTGDVVGFLASIYMRGIPHLQIPTTLLAQVDSSVGGKTGVDLPEGKNLLGSFHQPEAIWMDPQFFDTLPSVEFRQGMAEIIKTAMIGDKDLWEYLESNLESLRRRDASSLTRMISACCALKARVVESDEREAGYRRVLNLGHTVGHAVEKLCDYQVRHGDAVAMGLVAAARLAVRRGQLDRHELDRLESLCTAWELPVRLPRSFSADDVLMALKTDKKRVSGALHFILPVGIGQVVDLDNLDLQQLGEVLAALQGD
jgi:3-dehydroquinate synthase